MSPADKVVQSIFSVADKRPMLDFNYESDAEECAKKIGGAEIYDNKLQVVLPTPHGLELVCGSKNGETAFVFHDNHQAKHWFKTLAGYGVMYTEGPNSHQTVVVGQSGHSYGGQPIFPGVA